MSEKHERVKTLIVFIQLLPTAQSDVMNLKFYHKLYTSKFTITNGQISFQIRTYNEFVKQKF